VFIQLARKAWTIRDGQLLSGWIYRATHHAALNALRLEQRRRQRETDAMKLTETPSGAEPAWEHLAPLVDEAMQQLKRPEQDALLLRFFEDKSYGEVGRILRLDEKTAGQRVNRALEKMRQHFSRRGVTTTATLLASSLTSHAAAPVSAGMAANITGASLAGAGSGLLSGSFAKAYFMIITTKNVLVTAGVIAIAVASFQLGQQTAPAGKSAPVAKKSVAQTSLASGKSSAVPKNVPWDLQGPLAEILRKYKGGARFAALAKLVEQTPVSQLGELLDSASSCPQPGIAELVKALAYAKWASADPQGALAYATIASTRKGNSTDLTNVFSTWAGIDPQAALAAATKLERASFRADGVEEVLSIWVQGGDPMAAFTAMNNLPPGLATANLTLDLFNSWSPQCGGKCHHPQFGRQRPPSRLCGSPQHADWQPGSKHLQHRLSEMGTRRPRDRRRSPPKSAGQHGAHECHSERL
jgi:RNA polymerase sigma factor (sigma-70 family)